MKYLLLINTVPTAQAALDPETVMAEYMAYEKALAEAGVKLAGDALELDNATTITVSGGERVVTDGPFAETHEIVGGYYLLDLPDLDAALDWAARCPGAKHGSITVRTVWEMPA